MAKKRSNPLGISSKDVKDVERLKRRRSAHKLADFEKGTTSFKKLDRHTLGARAKRWDNWVRSVKEAKEKRKEELEELETAISQIKRGGKVSRKSGSKIMIGYKAGGKV